MKEHAIIGILGVLLLVSGIWMSFTRYNPSMEEQSKACELSCAPYRDLGLFQNKNGQWICSCDTSEGKANYLELKNNGK